MFKLQHQSQSALRSVADPVRSTRWQIFTVLSAQSLSGYAAILAFAPKSCSRNVWIRILSANDTLPMIDITAENILKER